MPSPAIYKIVNKTNGKYYVGSSINPARRWKNHVYNLENNNHINDYLQKAWNKYGKSCFDFVIVENPSGDLLLAEQKWLNKAKEDSKSYNLTFVSTCPNANLSEYSKLKRSNSLKNVVRTEEWKRKISESHMGMRSSLETKQKLSLIRKGKKQTDEQKEKATESRKKDWIFQSPIGEITHIHDLKSFCRQNGLHSGNMYWVNNGKKKQYKGWKSYPLIEKEKYKPTLDHIKKAAEGHAKNYMFISPCNKIINVCNLAQFCKQNNLDGGCMNKVAHGKLKQYKGWRKS